SEPDKTLHSPYVQDVVTDPFIVPTSNGIRYRASYMPGDYAERPVQVRGHESRAKEKVFAYWMTVSWINGRAENKVDAERTWKDSMFRRFFKTREDFDKAFGLKSDFSQYANDNVLFSAVIP